MFVQTGRPCMGRIEGIHSVGVWTKIFLQYRQLLTPRQLQRSLVWIKNEYHLNASLKKLSSKLLCFEHGTKLFSFAGVVLLSSTLLRSALKKLLHYWWHWFLHHPNTLVYIFVVVENLLWSVFVLNFLRPNFGIDFQPNDSLWTAICFHGIWLKEREVSLRTHFSLGC